MAAGGQKNRPPSFPALCCSMLTTFSNSSEHLEHCTKKIEGVPDASQSGLCEHAQWCT